jgi:hypothetical protein
MESEQSRSSSPQLLEAQETLKEMLEEACAAEIYSADTGQLVRIQKVLALADEAAREVISIRKERPRSRKQSRTRTPEAPSERAEGAAPDVSREQTHRVFEDARGVQWDACAIHPSAPVGRVQLPEPYRSGWLFFDSAVEKRRLSPIPPDWHSAPDEVLRAMCVQAEVVPERASSSRRRRPD